jgi:FlaG/FlaF family flagellin (archaellin)
MTFRNRRTDRQNASPQRRGRISYANVTATVALFLSLGAGSAYAAKHYLISSTKQIKPAVLAQLHGANGKNGTNGTNGTNGSNGLNGNPGPNGAGPSYSATSSPSVPFAANQLGNNTQEQLSPPTTIVQKTLPAGNYVISASVPISAVTGAGNEPITVNCTLTDGGKTDNGLWWTTTENDTGYNEAETTIPFLLVVSNSTASTAIVACQDEDPGDTSKGGVFLDPAGLSLVATDAMLAAVQTTASN